MAYYLLAFLFLAPSLCVPEDFSNHFPDNSLRAIHRPCTTAEYRCSLDCKQLELCVSNGTELISVGVYVCDNGELCDEDTKNCTLTLKSCPIPFFCTSAGVFPDPYDCTQFHVCAAANANDTKVACNQGFAFDASTGQCSLETADNPTECQHSQVPASCSEGLSGPLEWTAKYYYQCEDGIPVLYRCADGEFDSTTLNCTSFVSSTESATTSATPAVCTNSTVYADSANCSSYYLCKQGSAPQHKNCPVDTNYNPVLHMCLADSSVCQTSSPSYSTTCAEAGLYPDLLDCRFYYLCLIGLTPKHEKCETNRHFDATLGLCVLGTTCSD